MKCFLLAFILCSKILLAHSLTPFHPFYHHHLQIRSHILLHSTSIKASPKIFQDYKEELMQLAQISRNGDPNTPKQAMEVFSQMMEQFCDDEEAMDDDYEYSINDDQKIESLRPTTEIYNLVLQSLVSSPFKNYECTLQAIDILTQMEEASEDYLEELGARPNLQSYQFVMDGLISRRSPEQAEEIFQRLVKYSLNEESKSEFDEDDEDIELQKINPHCRSVYHRRMKAWVSVSNSLRKKVYLSVETIYQEMMKHNIRPTAKTFSLRILALSYTYPRPSRSLNIVTMAEEIYQEMLDLYQNEGYETCQPNLAVQNALLQIYAHHSSTSKTNEDSSSLKAVALLQPMIQDFRNNLDSNSTVLNAASFIHTINAMNQKNAKQAQIIASEKAISLLRMMMKLYTSTKKAEIKPNSKVYNAVLNTISRSQEQSDENGKTKAKLAQDLLKEMELFSTSNEKDNFIVPNLRSYNLVMSACAFSKFSTKDQNAQVCQIAMETFQACPDPDSITYGMFLKTCGKLMPSKNTKTSTVIQNIFHKCCQDGLLNDFVLSAFSKASSKEVRVDILGLEDVRQMKLSDLDIPTKWSQNTY